MRGYAIKLIFSVSIQYAVLGHLAMAEKWLTGDVSKIQAPIQ